MHPTITGRVFRNVALPGRVGTFGFITCTTGVGEHNMRPGARFTW